MFALTSIDDEIQTFYGVMEAILLLPIILVCSIQTSHPFHISPEDAIVHNISNPTTSLVLRLDISCHLRLFI